MRERVTSACGTASAPILESRGCIILLTRTSLVLSTGISAGGSQPTLRRGMDTTSLFGKDRGRNASHEVNGRGRQSKNKTWVSGGSKSGTSTPNHNEGDRWERGGRGGRRRGTGRPRTFPNTSLVVTHSHTSENSVSGNEEEDPEDYQEDEDEQQDQLIQDIEEPELDTPEVREKFYQEVCH